MRECCVGLRKQMILADVSCACVSMLQLRLFGSLGAHSCLLSAWMLFENDQTGNLLLCLFTSIDTQCNFSTVGNICFYCGDSVHHSHATGTSWHKSAWDRTKCLNTCDGNQGSFVNLSAKYIFPIIIHTHHRKYRFCNESHDAHETGCAFIVINNTWTCNIA